MGVDLIGDFADRLDDPLNKLMVCCIADKGKFPVGIFEFRRKRVEKRIFVGLGDKFAIKQCRKITA